MFTVTSKWGIFTKHFRHVLNHMTTNADSLNPVREPRIMLPGGQTLAGVTSHALQTAAVV